MKILSTVMLCVCFLACGQAKKLTVKSSTPKSSSDRYHEKQGVIFKAKSEELEKLGRIPTGFDAYRYMSQYGWYSGNESAIGNQPPLWLLQHGDGVGGAFGAYSFYQPAFEQAKNMWVFDGFMLPGSDLLWIKNSNIKFDKSVIGRIVPGLVPTGCYADNGNDPCEPEFKNPHYSGTLFPKSPGELENAKVIDVFGHEYESQSWGSDGSYDHGPEYWDGPLRLDKKATAFLEMHRIELLPFGYVDMCACIITTTSAQSETPAKACVQGGTLMPGETCSVSLGQK
jgi:hypothetical protein